MFIFSLLISLSQLAPFLLISTLNLKLFPEKQQKVHFTHVSQFTGVALVFREMMEYHPDSAQPLQEMLTQGLAAGQLPSPPSPRQPREQQQSKAAMKPLTPSAATLEISPDSCSMDDYSETDSMTDSSAPASATSATAMDEDG